MSASGTIFSRVEGKAADSVVFTVKLRDNTVFQESVLVDSDGLAKLEVQIKSPVLWHPHGYGAQPLYEVSAELKARDFVLDSVTKRTGLRRGELVQDVDEIGKTFYFRVYNVDVFCAGSCWIPADSFLPRITADKYRKWLQLMVDGHQVMTRYVMIYQDPKSH
jgi:beta-mannosidase